MRLFFALWPDFETRACLAAAAALPEIRAANAVPSMNYHLTLAFVGEVADSGLTLLQQIGCALRAEAFTIKIDDYQYWPESRVLAAVARETPVVLPQLSARLHEELSLHSAQLNPGRRRLEQWAQFRAHVTLARKVAQAPVLKAMLPIVWAARSFSLVRSDTSSARSIYTVVDTWPLLDKTAKP